MTSRPTAPGQADSEEPATDRRCVDIHAMLLRAEAKALKNLDEHKPKTASLFYEENLHAYENIYATACAVRRNWEDCERRASKENQSASSYKYQTGDSRILVRERDALPAKERFFGMGVVLPTGEQWVLLDDLSNAGWKQLSAAEPEP